MEKLSAIETCLHHLNAAHDGIRGSALISDDGLCLVSVMDASVDRILFATVASATLAFANRLCNALGHCEAEFGLIGCCGGRSLFVPAGRDAILALILELDGDWEDTLRTARMTAGTIARLLH